MCIPEHLSYVHWNHVDIHPYSAQIHPMAIVFPMALVIPAAGDHRALHPSDWTMWGIPWTCKATMSRKGWPGAAMPKFGTGTVSSLVGWYLSMPKWTLTHRHTHTYIHTEREREIVYYCVYFFANITRVQRVCNYQTFRVGISSLLVGYDSNSWL